MFLSFTRYARRALAIAGTVLCTLAPAAISPAPADPYEINVITPLTGIGAFIGKNEAAALALVEKNVNDAGGIRGRQIKFVVQDDQSSPQVAVQLLNGLVAKHVPIVLGSTLAAMCSAMLPLIDNGPVDYCFSSAVHPPRGSYMYSGNLSTTDLIAILVRYYREKGWKKLALIVTTDASGQDGEHGVDTALAAPENKGLTLVDREHFNGSDLSVTAQMARIKASGAQALIVYAAGTPLGTVLHAVADGGVDLPVGTTSANLSYEAMKQFASFLPKTLLFVAPPGVAYDALPAGPLKNVVHTFVDSSKAAGLHADIGLIAAWDPAIITVAALKQIGFGITAPQMKDYIDRLHDFPGVYGVYDFRDGSQRGLAPSNGIVVRWDPARDYWTPVSSFGGGL
jgi:branched-chain amino acid transport system substrate-binding protein